jgi:hypothetical protein
VFSLVLMAATREVPDNSHCDDPEQNNQPIMLESHRLPRLMLGGVPRRDLQQTLGTVYGLVLVVCSAQIYNRLSAAES